MKLIKLYEEYINSSTNRVNTFLKNLVQSLNETFSGSNNALGVKDIETLSLIDVEQSNTSDAIEKNILMRFSDTMYQYQMIFVIKIEDVKNETPITDAYMKLKIYDGNNADLIREWQSNLSVAESTDNEMNDEGRWFVKVAEKNQSQKESQEESQEESQKEIQNNDMDFIESFIINKVGFLKEMIEKSTDGPQLDMN